MKTIAIMNVKGGVGKTITACNMAHILAKDYNQRVLLVDADPQGDASEFYGVEVDDRGSLTDLLLGIGDVVDDYIFETDYARLRILPADSSLFLLDLDTADGKLDEYTRRFSDVKEILAEDGETDVVLIDCPPSFTPSAIAALKAADSVIIPVKMDAFSVRGMEFLLDQIAVVQRLNGAADLEGVLVTIWHRCEICAQLEQKLRDSGIRVFETHIRRSDMADESTVMRSPIREYSARCAAAQDYRDFVAEFVKTGGLTRG